MAYAWSLEVENLYQLRKTFPVVAASLTATIERFEKDPLHLMQEVAQTGVVTPNTVVVVVPAQLGIQLRK